MAEKSIAKTFKGILRVANVQEATDQNEDYYFNPIYYGTPNKGIASESTGYDSAYNAMSSLLIRYSFPEDPYRNNSVPITDSLGNYMNINVSGDSVTFGSDEQNNGNNADKQNFTQLLYNKTFSQEKIFPVLTADKLIVGLKERVLPELKSSINAGAINIDESPYFDEIDAKLIINNNYDHTPSHISSDGQTYTPISTTNDKDKTYRTIFQNTNSTVRDYDSLIHYQDNIDWRNFSVNKTVDSIVDIVNLKDYVKEKLNLFLGNNIVEVPTGMVIWQYVDLRKWYCSGSSFTGSSSAGTTKKVDNFMGNNPPMGRIEEKDVQDTNNYSPTIYQGVVRKGINRLVALSHEETEEETDNGDGYDNKQLKEIIPLYKRDYALADGSTFTIHLLLPEMSDQYNYPSYDQFIDIFFAHGYQYTDSKVIRNHYANTKTTLNGESVYRWKSNKRTVSTACSNKDVLFGIDLLTMLAVKCIYEELKYGTSNNGRSACVDANGYINRTNIQNWLKTKALPRQFIFNTPVPSSQGGMVYQYKEGGTKTPKTYNIEIGLEVNSFGSKIWYYDHDTSKYVAVEAWKTAEIQGVLDLFEMMNIERERELKTYYQYPFQIVNAVQNLEDYATGTFFGYTPFVWSDDSMFSTQLKTVSSFSSSTHPHRHAIFMGPQFFKLTPDVKIHTGSISSSSMSRAEGAVAWYGTTRDTVWTKRAVDANVDSYFMAEMKDIRYDHEIHNGVLTKVIQWGENTKKDHVDPRWRSAEPNRGITGPPIDQGIIDEKYVSASANTLTGEIKWFQPDCLQMLPLVKL